MASVAAAPRSPTATTSHVSRPPIIPTGLVPAAMLLAAAVGLLALLPSLAQAVWEVPHLFLLGAVISFGVFTGQRNNAAAAAAGSNAATKDSSSLAAWNARYRPDDPLVVIADHEAPSVDEEEDGGGLELERPLSLPVRRLKPSPSPAAAAAAEESETGGDAASDGFGGEETDSCASSSTGFWAGARAVPSPPSVLDAGLGLSPCSLQPQSSDERPFFVQHFSADDKSRASNAATPASAVPRGFVHYSPVQGDDQPLMSDDGEVTDDDWDEDAEDDGSDEMAPVSSERSVRGESFAGCASDDHNDGDGDGYDTSVDEELLKLAAKAEPDGEEEVDRKADAFIAKIREQIRLQRQ